MKRTKRRKATPPMAARHAAGPAPRRVRLVAALALAGVLVAGAAVAMRYAACQADRTGAFRVAALEVRGLRLLTGEEVLRASGVDVGTELFGVDLDAVAARLDSLVWVRSVRVERKPPDRLVVHLEERRRALWIEWAGRLYGLDADAVLLPPDRLPTEGIADLDLPVLRHPRIVLSDSLRVGQTVADSSVRRLVDWWTAARRVAPELAGEISQLEPLDDTSLTLRLVADDLEVRLPYGQVARRLRTLREVLARVYGECPDPAYVDLRFAGQAVIGRQASAHAPTSVGGPRDLAGDGERLGHG